VISRRSAPWRSGHLKSALRRRYEDEFISDLDEDQLDKYLGDRLIEDDGLRSILSSQEAAIALIRNIGIPREYLWDREGNAAGAFEYLVGLFDEIILLQKELQRQKKLRRERDKRNKATRKARDQKKHLLATDPWIKLAKLDNLAENGATESERANARQMASELRGRLMSNAA